MSRVGGAAALVAVLALVGCAAPGGDAEPDEGAGSAPESSAATEPVIAENFPDPDVLQTEDGYYAYSTESNRQNVPVAFSTDLETWELRGDAMPELPSWIIPGKTWAPEVTEVSPGNYVMYFTATNFAPTFQCVGVATATDPAGPFEIVGDEMLVCPENEGGAIDATTVRTDDGLHLVWKNDGNALGVDTWIQTAPLSDDGLTLEGEPVRLLKQDQEWEGEVVEAPTVVAHDDGFTLLYSANSYGAEFYGIGYATADELEGPWTKVEGPWVSTETTDNRVLGPGGQDVITGPDGEPRLVFHGWDEAFSYRVLYVAPLEWDGREPVVDFG